MEGHAHKKRKVDTGYEVVDGEQEESISLPLSRVKNLMESATEAKLSKDAIKTMAKATELFVRYITQLVLDPTLRSKRKILRFIDFQEVVGRQPNLAFLKESRVLDVIAAEITPSKTKSSQETPQTRQDSQMELEDPIECE